MSPSEPGELPVSEPSNPVKDLVDTAANSLGTDFILDAFLSQLSVTLPYLGSFKLSDHR